MTSNLQTPINYLKGVGPNRANLLQSELGIYTFQDLLNLFPNRYIDRTKFYKINELNIDNTEVQVVGYLTDFEEVTTKKGRRLTATFKDETGIIELVWFRGYKWIKDSMALNKPYVAFGRLNFFNGRFNIPHPELELLSNNNKGLKSALQAIYPSTEKLSNRGISNRLLRSIMEQLFLETKGNFFETLPVEIINHLKLVSKSEALLNIHFPKSGEHLAKAQFRLKFEELFYIQLQLIQKNLIHKKKIKGFPFESVGHYFNTFYNSYLPFKLTYAQKKVLKEIRLDVGSLTQMNRLLQGDVGSGKTIVAFMSMLMALDNNYQTCLMAPTEILAIQHYNTISAFCEPLKINIALLTGSTKTAQRKILNTQLKNGQLQILIGTHALLEDNVKFNNLGLAIIDEQHRFGVAQRSKLWLKNPTKKNKTLEVKNTIENNLNNPPKTERVKALPPHILVMTATPIPRTLAMTLYGDLDISVINELPAGRKPIKTIHQYDSKRLHVFNFMKREIAKGRQIYVVYPLIKESESLDYKDLMDGYESIAREFPAPQYQISIVHGQMKTADKDYEMQRFINGKTQIMVATTVIEVGVDVPNASVMVIESAERFGLSQLHQLRGRVGRGSAQSYCVLMTSFKLSADSKTRIETMVSTNDGFKIAEVDLKLRGPGDIMGTQQSGILQLKIANIQQDEYILNRARYYAKKILHSDMNLTAEKYKMILHTLNQMSTYKNIWNYIS